MSKIFSSSKLKWAFLSSLNWQNTNKYPNFAPVHVYKGVTMTLQGTLMSMDVKKVWSFFDITMLLGNPQTFQCDYNIFSTTQRTSLFSCLLYWIHSDHISNTFHYMHFSFLFPWKPYLLYSRQSSSTFYDNWENRHHGKHFKTVSSIIEQSFAVAALF